MSSEGHSANLVPVWDTGNLNSKKKKKKRLGVVVDTCKPNLLRGWS